MKKLCIIIRVYNRVEDLGYCIDIIRDTWKQFEYYIIIVANGSGKGFIVDESVKAKADKFVNLEVNAGHFKGNSQLLTEGLPHIPADCSYTVLLEADTWIYGDELVKKYTEKLAADGAVWASAQFFSYALNVATDFAIADSPFIKLHPGVVTFEGMPEYYVARFMHSRGFKFIHIKEISPVNLPKYIRRYPFAPTGRFNIFPKAKIVTHHIEDLPGGMEQKKAYFNAVSGVQYFEVAKKIPAKMLRLKFKIAETFFYILPHKGWFVKK